jgi:hypothetical protein
MPGFVLWIFFFLVSYQPHKKLSEIGIYVHFQMSIMEFYSECDLPKTRSY